MMVGYRDRVVIGLFVWALVGSSGRGTDAQTPASPPPAPAPPPAPVPAATSVLLITLDTTRADHLSAYGYRRPTTPTIDSMAREGVRVEHAYTTMPSTDPAHLSILSGRYPRSHGTRRNGVSAVPGLPNLASWAAARGRRTAAFVSRKHVRPSELGIAGFDVEDGPDTRASGSA